jgi:hypothetical protein
MSLPIGAIAIGSLISAVGIVWFVLYTKASKKEK